jgi:hypothetical protein
VIVLGVLLVGGTLSLIVAIIVRAPHPSQSPAAARAIGQSGAAPFDTAVDLPAGAVIQSIQSAGERLAVHLVLADGGQQIIVFDLGSGARIGTIALRPAR